MFVIAIFVPLELARAQSVHTPELPVVQTLRGNGLDQFTLCILRYNMALHPALRLKHLH